MHPPTQHHSNAYTSCFLLPSTLSTFVFPFMYNGNWARLSRVTRGRSKMNIFDYHFAFLPVNYSHHWILVVIQASAKRIAYVTRPDFALPQAHPLPHSVYNSIDGCGPLHLFKLVRLFIMVEATAWGVPLNLDDWTDEVVKVPQQVGLCSRSCTDFVCLSHRSPGPAEEWH